MCVCVYVCVCACVRACVRACVCVKSIYCLDDNKPQGDVKFVCDDTQPSFHPTDNEGVVMVWVNEGVAARQYVGVCQDGFSRQAAAAVCHQRGYIDAQPTFPGNNYYGTPHQLGLE